MQARSPRLRADCVVLRVTWVVENGPQLIRHAARLNGRPDEIFGVQVAQQLVQGVKRCQKLFTVLEVDGQPGGFWPVVGWVCARDAGNPTRPSVVVRMVTEPCIKPKPSAMNGCPIIRCDWAASAAHPSGTAVVRQWYGSGTAVVRQWYGSGTAVVRQWYGSGTAVVRQ